MPLFPAAARAGSRLAAAGRRLWARRRRALVAAALAWLALGLAGGLVQYAPQGWTVPVGQWHAAVGNDLYWIYPWTPHWAVVVIPAFLGKALPVAALFGASTAMAAQPGSRGRHAACGSLAGAGLVAGVAGMLTCCSTLALALAGLLGATATAAMFDLADIGLVLAGGLLTLGLAWQASSETSSPGGAAHLQGDAASPHRTSIGGRG